MTIVSMMTSTGRWETNQLRDKLSVLWLWADTDKPLHLESGSKYDVPQKNPKGKTCSNEKHFQFTVWFCFYLTVFRYLMKKKKSSLPSYNTTATCKTKTCTCYFNSIYNHCSADGDASFSSKTRDTGRACVVEVHAAFNVLLVAADPNTQSLCVTLC